MSRALTPEEEAQVVEYVKQNPRGNPEETAAHFEKVFEMPVTKMCVTRVVVEAMMQDEEFRQILLAAEGGEQQ